MIIRNRTVLAICTGLLCQLGAMVASTTAWANGYTEVRRQLFEAAIKMGIESDYVVVGDAYYETIDEDDSGSIELTLKGGHDYAIVSVCDDDCDDVDVFLYDDNGDLIDKDVDDDDVAALRGQPDRSGRYFVRFKMEDCDSDPCVVGALLFKRK